MTAEERTHTRPSEYSEWHRTLGHGCCAIDVDFVELRGEEIVGLTGVTACIDAQHCRNCKDIILQRTELERIMLKKIATALKTKAYYVIHAKDMSFFIVIDLDDMHELEMCKEEYEGFIMHMGEKSQLVDFL